MIGKYFRPWGKLDWIIPKLPQANWDFLACLSTEDRYIAALSILDKSIKLNKSLFIKIIDPFSKDTEAINKKLSENEENIKLSTQYPFSIEDHPLLEQTQNIVECVKRFLLSDSKNIIIDISTFPKRFFFPILKLLIQSNPENLIVVYTNAEKYCNELSGNPRPWDHLPLFMPVNFPEAQVDVAIVGVGFMPFALPDLLLSKYNATPVKFLFPFPPGPPNYQRTWEFVRKIQKHFTFKSSDHMIRIDSNNMPDAFEYISREGESGDKKIIFAPYGPKPISLAMCIFATLNDSTVYYTQPTHYSIDYSSGIKDTLAYPVILSSKNLYKDTIV